jgi:hypothetical protein
MAECRKNPRTVAGAVGPLLLKILETGPKGETSSNQGNLRDRHYRYPRRP